MLYYPDINPVAVQIGPLAIYWYGVMYLLSFLLCWFLVRRRAMQGMGPLKPVEVNDLILFWGPLSVVLGGRIGYVLFYQFKQFMHDPFYLFRIWEGGMSFHGGLIGVIIAVIWFAKRHKVSAWDVSDLIVPVMPIGLGLGRLGNFINGELWGRVTELPWGMVFPNGGPLPRHPTQLYEAFIEGFALWLVLWLYSAKRQPRMAVTAMFFMLYGIFRFSIEFVREPDAHLGFIMFDTLTMGQMLSIPMFLIGLGLLIRSYYASVS